MNSGNDSTGLLEKHHQEMIDNAGISVEVAANRHYQSVSKKAKLEQMGFTRIQSNVPSLLIPLYDYGGNQAGLHLRPDQPRNQAGRH